MVCGIPTFKYLIVKTETSSLELTVIPHKNRLASRLLSFHYPRQNCENRKIGSEMRDSLRRRQKRVGPCRRQLQPRPRALYFCFCGCTGVKVSTSERNVRLSHPWPRPCMPGRSGCLGCLGPRHEQLWPWEMTWKNPVLDRKDLVP